MGLDSISKKTLKLGVKSLNVRYIGSPNETASIKIFNGIVCLAGLIIDMENFRKVEVYSYAKVDYLVHHENKGGNKPVD